MVVQTEWAVLKRDIIPFTRPTPALEVASETVIGDGTWIDRSPRSADARWYERNRSRLSNVAGLWIAIRNQQIVASAASFKALYEQLSAVHTKGALVVQVPKAVSERTYLIA